jgi:hypothetical protein
LCKIGQIKKRPTRRFPGKALSHSIKHSTGKSPLGEAALLRLLDDADDEHDILVPDLSMNEKTTLYEWSLCTSLPCRQRKTPLVLDDVGLLSLWLLAGADNHDRAFHFLLVFTIFQKIIPFSRSVKHSVL